MKQGHGLQLRKTEAKTEVNQARKSINKNVKMWPAATRNRVRYGRISRRAHVKSRSFLHLKIENFFIFSFTNLIDKYNKIIIINNN